METIGRSKWNFWSRGRPGASDRLRTWARDTDKNESREAGRRCVYPGLCDASSVRWLTGKKLLFSLSLLLWLSFCHSSSVFQFLRPIGCVPPSLQPIIRDKWKVKQVKCHSRWVWNSKRQKFHSDVKRHCNNHVRQRTQRAVVCANGSLLRAMWKGLL